MKVQAPRGCRAISIGGAEIALDDAGAVEVPEHIGHDLIAYHRFRRAAPVAVAAAKAKGDAKGDKEPAKPAAK